tara:strand:+ start:164 stop:976 length:813 start_codon:yes stop_codon:yes gene_type:complete
MKILLNSTDLKKELKKQHGLGFVPTMGSIHKGHEYLISKSKEECPKTLVSIFINPKQFNNKSDLKNYPRNFKDDIRKLKRLKIDYVFLPDCKDIYRIKRKKKITLKKKNLILCAQFRKGHFEGVLDIMDRFTKLINPKNIYMGEKDFQQFYLVKEYLQKRYNTKVIKCKTIRNVNNVALSSRNLLLSANSLKKASQIINELKKIKKNLINKTNFDDILNQKIKYLKNKFNIQIEYLELRNKNDLKKSLSFKNSKLFVAYYINKIRLIDNL